MREKTWPQLSIAEADSILTAPGAPFEIEETILGTSRIQTWKNVPTTLRDVFLNGMQHGDREFLVYESDRVTFDAFARATITLAHRLARDGVSKGDRVAVVMRNLPEWPVAFWAGQLLGAIVAPMNSWWTSEELAYAVNDSGAKVAIVDFERLARLDDVLDRLPTLERIYAVRSEGSLPRPQVRAFEDVTGSIFDWSRLPLMNLPEISLAADDAATLLYTSGTSGKPKGALGSHRNITSTIATAAVSVARYALRAGEAPSIEPPGSAPRVNLLAVPLFHSNGLMVTLAPALNSGAKLVLMRRWDPETALKLIERERVTHTGGVPTIALQLVEHPAITHYDLSSLKFVVYGGSPASPELVQRLGRSLPGVTLGYGWGMTEVSGAFTRNLGKDYEDHPESAGLAPPIGAMQVRGLDDHAALAPGEVGELWIKGPQVIKGYWNDPEATAATFVDGWLRTGDIARIDQEGFLYVIDRVKDMLIRGGENIYCVEVENVLYEHPDVVDAALVGIPHDTLGEEPAAVIYLRPGGQVAESELREMVAARLAAYKVPVKFAFWETPLPRNIGGKIMKNELRLAFST